MISQISGTIIDKTDKSLIIGTSGGVGYEVFCTPTDIMTPALTTKISLHTHMAVRDNAMELYGFTDKRELSFFKLLVHHVSGVGPKTAMGIMSAASSQTLTQAVHTKDSSVLTKIAGIGKKQADKIVLELQNKVDITGIEEGQVANENLDVLEALQALGYREREAREALHALDMPEANTADKIKAALKLLQK